MNDGTSEFTDGYFKTFPEEYNMSEGKKIDGRVFASGATRDTEEGKLDYEGFLSPHALEAYARYMHKNRHTADGKLRDGDNWQKGIPLDVYMKSMWRHLIHVWRQHREGLGLKETMTDALCALIFNAMGYLHEIRKPVVQKQDEDLSVLEALQKQDEDPSVLEAIQSLHESIKAGTWR